MCDLQINLHNFEINLADINLNFDTIKPNTHKPFQAPLPPKTVKFTGLIHNLPVTVLIDSGSSHNILQPYIAHHLHLAISPSPPLSVMVGNEAFIQCQGLCPSVDISLQHSTFTIPFYLLPIEGVDVVLGVNWLSTLGSIQKDFSIPSIAFTHNNQQITLQATTSPTPSVTTYHQFCHYLSNNFIASLHLLSVENQPSSPTDTAIAHPSSPLDNLPSPIQSLLQKYHSIFHKPHGLPPQRSHDHHIPLLPWPHNFSSRGPTRPTKDQRHTQLASAKISHGIKGFPRPHQILQNIYKALHHIYRSSHRLITKPQIYMDGTCATSFWRIEATGDTNTYPTPSQLQASLCGRKGCIRSSRRSCPESNWPSTRLLQQKDEPQVTGFLRICPRDVCHHRVSKKMASVSHGTTFHNNHRSEKPQHPSSPNHTNPITTKMDS